MREYERQLLGRILKGKDTWMYRAIIFACMLRYQGIDVFPLLHATKEELSSLVVLPDEALLEPGSR